MQIFKKIKDFITGIFKKPKIIVVSPPEPPTPPPPPPPPTKDEYEKLREWIFDFDWTELDPEMFPTTRSMLEFKVDNWWSMPEDFKLEMEQAVEDTFA